jgi:hypothetical protein
MSIAPNGDGFILDDDGMAVPAADVLSDFFAEHSDDPDEGPPEDWPAWTDEIRLDLGAPSRREECLDDMGIDVTDDATLEDLRHWERFPALSGESEPDPDRADDEDLDALERLAYEAGCNMHWAP